MEVNTLEEVKALLLSQDRFMILMHTKPDGDALGSAYALLKFLLNQGKQAFIGLEEEIFYKYQSFFPKEERDLFFKNYSKIKPQDYEYIIIVDTSSYNLLGIFKDQVMKQLDKTFILDHHIVREELEAKNYIRHVSSTSELVLDIVGFDGLDHLMAQALYMGIVFDTGQFRHNSANADVFYKVSKILERFPINLEDIFYRLFENETIERKKLIGELTYHTEFFAQGQIAVCYLSIQLIENLRKKGVVLTEDDMLDLTVFPHSLKGVEVSVMIREKREQSTFSFRSRCDFNVSEFASQFGGGGHKKAAGLKLERTSYENITQRILIPLERSFVECINS